jgi:hypothetical protein
MSIKIFKSVKTEVLAWRTKGAEGMGFWIREGRPKGGVSPGMGF